MQGDKNQYVDHIIETNTKFMSLNKDMAKERINLEDRLLHCQEREEKLVSLRNHHRDQHQKTDNDFKDMDTRLRQQIKELRDKLQVDRDVRLDLQAQIDKITKGVQEAKLKNEELSKYISEKNLMDGIQRNIDEDEDRILKEQILAKKEILEACQQSYDESKKALDSDPKLSDLKKRNLELQEELKKKQIEASDVEYRVIEIESRQKLAIQHKEKEAEERKRLADQYDEYKDKLEEEKRKNEMKVNKKLAESTFDELTKREIVLQKMKSELATINAQYEKVHKDYKNYKLDEFRKNNYLDKLKRENDVYNLCY
jgi:DNA repair exonuclease SbcCD ATPase subunit